MRKIKVVMLSALVALASFAAISCANNTEETALDKLNKLKNVYGFEATAIPYNQYGPNYQIMIPLQNVVSNFSKPVKGELYRVSFDYLSYGEFPELKVNIVYTSTDIGWDELSSEDYVNGTDGLKAGSHGTYSHEFIINTTSYGVDIGQYMLVINCKLRDGESSTNHEESLNLYTNNLNVIAAHRRASLVGGKVVISSESNDTHGIKITLNGTNEKESDKNYWEAREYSTIVIEDGMEISLSETGQRPIGYGKSKTIYYPFVSVGKIYKFTFMGESVYIFNEYDAYGDVDLSQIKNITLTKPEGLYPKAKLENVSEDILNSVLTTADAKQDFKPEYTLTLWGGTDWSNWLGYATLYSDDFNKCTLDLNLITGKLSDNTSISNSYSHSDAITSINNLNGWWYGITYRIKAPASDLKTNYFNCQFEYGFGSPRYDTTGVTLVDERY